MRGYQTRNLSCHVTKTDLIYYLYSSIKKLPTKMEVAPSNKLLLMITLLYIDFTAISVRLRWDELLRLLRLLEHLHLQC